jgi:transcription termination factor NusB
MKNKGKEVAVRKDSLVDPNFKKSVDTTIANREYLRSQIESILVEGTDFYIIKDRKSLGKSGAEKLATIYKLTAKFEIDKEIGQIFAEMKGLIAFKCFLYDDKEVFRGQGGGSDTLARNQGDPNRAIKMAQKRAYIDAVIRTVGLSDVFTQDLEDMNGQEKKVVAQAKRFVRKVTTTTTPFLSKATAKQLEFIEELLQQIPVTKESLEKQIGKPIAELTIDGASKVINQLKDLLPPPDNSEVKNGEIIK